VNGAPKQDTGGLSWKSDKHSSVKQFMTKW